MLNKLKQELALYKAKKEHIPFRKANLEARIRHEEKKISLSKKQ
jgi:hypothetical protein